MTVTNPQRKLMRAMAKQGMPTCTIAAIFEVSCDTVRFHTNAKSAKRIRAQWAKRDAKRREQRRAARESTQCTL